MGEVKHTAGSWVVEDETDPMLTILAPDANGDVVAHIVDVDWLDDPAKVGPKCLANARLIASAPDLLDALKAAQTALAMIVSPFAIEATTTLDAYTHALNAEQAARAAIAKATGSDQ
jgi:hypothetical protein